MESNRNAAKSVVSVSPSLQRSRSSAPAIHRASAPDAHPLSSNSPRSLISRSNSTSKARSKPKQAADENRNPKAGKPPDSRGSLGGIFYRHRISDASAESAAKPKKTRFVAGSPSAWALSPGRSPVIDPLEKQRNGVGGVGSVLRLFRQKKDPSARELATHRLRMLQTRWMQWRFVNARAQAAMAAEKSTAEKKVFNAWFENHQLRSSLTEKRNQILKLKAQIKLQQILQSQIPLLNQWERIDQSTLEALTRTVRILLAAASKVPFVDGAKANVFSVHETLCAAMDVMEGIVAPISIFSAQVENLSSLLTELVKVVKQEGESLEELMKFSATMASLEAEERSLRAHLIQEQTDRAALSPHGFCRLSDRIESVNSELKKLKSQFSTSAAPVRSCRTSVYDGHIDDRSNWRHSIHVQASSSKGRSPSSTRITHAQPNIQQVIGNANGNP